ncbi:MAG: DUF3098 domain-containing protein [Cryomorphaceae bacterium]|nr:DUF3098 domain-containing protein [Cryomorphaceae bacterium]
MKEFAFQRENYKLLLVGLVIIIVGFILMSGGGVDDPNEFSEDIFNFRRITLAPLVVLGGYGFVMFAIMKKPKSASNQKSL